MLRTGRVTRRAHGVRSGKGVQPTGENVLRNGLAFVRQFSNPALSCGLGHPVGWSPIFPQGLGIGFTGPAATRAPAVCVSVR